jgi:hypothetical protein
VSDEEGVYVDGELHLTLETVAEIYCVEVVWLREAYNRGLLGAGRDMQRTVCIVAARLDHVAIVVRLRHLVGRDIDAVARALAEIDPLTWEGASGS